MDDWQPAQVWESVRRRVREWWGADKGRDAESNEDEVDPTMMFHLSVSAPIVIGLLILMRRTVA
jgi:hypothetical protein